MGTIRIIGAKDAGTLLKRRAARMDEAEKTVRPILDAVKKRGDQAVLEYARKFDGFDGRSLRVAPFAHAQRWEQRHNMQAGPSKQNVLLQQAHLVTPPSRLSQPTGYAADPSAPPTALPSRHTDGQRIRQIAGIVRHRLSQPAKYRIGMVEQVLLHQVVGAVSVSYLVMGERGPVV